MKKFILLYSIIGLILLSCKKEKEQLGIVDPPEEEIELGDPEITAISPLEGAPLSMLTITGKNFSKKVEENEVTINGIIARIISVNNTTIQAEVPEDAETGAVTVRVLSKSVTGPEFTVKKIPVYIYLSATYAGTSGVKGFQDGSRLTAQFNVPEGIDRDSKGNLLITDRDNHVIRKITPDGQVLTIAGAAGEKGDVDGAPGSARFNAPLKLAVDAHDNIYIAERDNNKIRKIDAVTGNVSTVAGTGERGYADGPAASAKFYSPIDVAVADDGTIYVAESQDRIRKITSDGIVSTLAGSTRGFADGVGTDAKLSDPSGLTIDKDGNILVADRRNHRIRKITPAGVTTTLAGSSGGYADGISESAKFFHPWGIYAAKDGTIYVTDAGNNSVRMMNPEGVWSTIGGTGGTTEDGYQDGYPSKYAYPTDLTVDEETGIVYVVDFTNQVIRTITRTEKE